MTDQTVDGDGLRSVQGGGRWVLASRNAGKAVELRALLGDSGLAVDLHPLADFTAVETAEPHGTFVENALAKARAACVHSGLPALADDSGLVVPALGGAPGVRSARFAGAGADDAANNAALLAAMAGVADRRACFVSVLVWLAHAEDPLPLVAVGQWWGEITVSPRGAHGFGYDPLFLDPEWGCTAAEMTSAQKNARSHRGRAVAAFAAAWRAPQRWPGT